VPVAEIQRGIKNGVRKINIDTDQPDGDDRPDPQGAQRGSQRVRSRKYLKPR